jgi:hypothetical protein
MNELFEKFYKAILKEEGPVYLEVEDLMDQDIGPAYAEELRNMMELLNREWKP